jgi:hypothetical protein
VRKEYMNCSDSSEGIQPANYPTSDEGLTCWYKEVIAVKVKKQIKESYEVWFSECDNCKVCCVVGCHVM